MTVAAQQPRDVRVDGKAFLKCDLVCRGIQPSIDGPLESQSTLRSVGGSPQLNAQRRSGNEMRIHIQPPMCGHRWMVTRIRLPLSRPHSASI